MTKAIRVLRSDPAAEAQRDVAVVYVRVSRLDRDDRQKVAAGNGANIRALSPRTQIEQCRAMPALRGLRVEVFEDLHRSGKDTNRPGLERMLERIDSPDVAAVAVWSISRLARSVPDLYQLIERFHDAGIAFVSAKESIDTSNAYGRAFLGFLAVLAQFERELTAERLSANLAQRAYDGYLVGPLPAGYDRDEAGEVVIDEPRAAVVRRLFEEYSTGRHSFDSLARWANAEGLQPPQRRRGRSRRASSLTHFTHDSIYALVSNMRYAGKFIHVSRRSPDGDVIRGKFPALITEELWERCAEIRRNGRKLLTGDKRVTRYPLTGLLACATCGDNVRGDTMRSGRRRYLCRGLSETRLCVEPQASADTLEAEILAWLRAVRIEPEWQEVYAREVSRLRRAPQRAQTLTQRLRALERQIELKRVSWEAGAYKSEAMYRGEVAALRAEMEAVRSAPEAPIERQAATIETIADGWEEMRPDQRKRLLATVFQELTVKGGRLDGARPRPGWVPYFEHALARVPRVDLGGFEPLTP